MRLCGTTIEERNGVAVTQTRQNILVQAHPPRLGSPVHYWHICERDVTFWDTESRAARGEVIHPQAVRDALTQ
jgi:hypothetical protein